MLHDIYCHLLYVSTKKMRPGDAVTRGAAKMPRKTCIELCGRAGYRSRVSRNPGDFLTLDAIGQGRDRAQTSVRAAVRWRAAVPGARPVNHSFFRRSSFWLSLAVALSAAACGYSQEE